TLGPAHIAGMCVELLPSSQVMNSAALCAWKTKLFRISGTILERNVSPVEMGQLCMSSQRLGVSHIKFEAVIVEPRSWTRFEASIEVGTTLLHSAGLFWIFEKYTNGSCLATYCPKSFW